MKTRYTWILALLSLLVALFGAGCTAQNNTPALELSTERPSLLFFYTDN